MQKARRIAIIAAGSVAVFAIAGFLAYRSYLKSDSVKNLAGQKLSEKLGAEVVVTNITSGAGSTTLQIELPSGPNEPPLIKGTVRVDVSPIGLAAGSQPSDVRVDEASVHLHLNAEGDILSKLPQPPSGGGGSLPKIELRNSTITIAQDGRPEFRVSGVDVSVSEANGKLSITGGMRDQGFGAWTLAGEFLTDGSTGQVTGTTAGAVAVTPNILKSIPFIPTETWENVELDGQTSATVRIGRGADKNWNWRVECDPVQTKLKVMALDLVTTDTSGKVVVDGAKVTLTGVEGKSADGTIQANAVLDFGPTPTKLDFQVHATDLDVKKTPASWGLVQRVDSGRLNGKGNITLLITDGQVRPHGKGKATIKGKAFGGEADVEVFLRSDGKRLQFSDTPDAVQVDDQLLRVLASILIQAPLPTSKPADEEAYVRANLKFTDVDLAQLIAKGNIASPVKIAGKASLQVTAEIPTGAVSSIKGYRAKGSLTTPSLQIEGLTLTDVSAEVELRDGVLKLTKFAANFPKSGSTPAGGFSGTASFGIDPRTELVANLKLDSIPLKQVLAAIPGFQDKADGTISGTFDLKIPGVKISDVTAYQANGKLTSDGITVFGQKAEKLNLELSLKNGIAQLAKAEAKLYDGSISGEAKFALAGKVDGTFQLNFQGLDSAVLTKAIPESPVKLSGKVDGKLKGTLPPLDSFDATKITGDLDLQSTRLVVQGVPATKLTGKLGAKSGAITYDLKGDALGGNFDVNGTYPLGKPALKEPNAKPPGGSITLRRLRLDRLDNELRLEFLKPLSGNLSLTLKYTHGSDGPTGSGRLEIRDLGWGNSVFETSDIVSDIRIDTEGIEIPSLAGTLAGGTLRGRLNYEFENSKRSFINLRLENAEAATLLAPLGLTADSGRISVILRSSFGKQIRGTGNIISARATVEGIPVSDVRIPLAWTFIPGGAAQLTIRDAAATVANGRVTARTEVTFNATADVDGRVEFIDVNIGELAKAFGSNAYGIGKTTGRFDFNGDNVRTANDLKGTVTARFGQTTVKEIPILGSVTSLLSPVQALTRFDSGELVARLGTGQFRFERLLLTSPSAKLFAEGTVSLAKQLDLDVVYNTGQIGPAAPLLRTVLRDIPAIGPIPVGLIVRVSEAASNRIVRLRITGNTGYPVVRVNAANLLTENAVRFFVGQYVPLSNGTR